MQRVESGPGVPVTARQEPQDPISPNRLMMLQARVGALVAVKAPIVDSRMARGLPPLNDRCSRADGEGWAVLLRELEDEYGFVPQNDKEN